MYDSDPHVHMYMSRITSEALNFTDDSELNNLFLPAVISRSRILENYLVH